MSLLVQRVVECADYILVLARLRRDVCQFLGDGAAGDGHAVAVQQSVGKQHLQHLRGAAGLVQIGNDIFTRGFEVAQHRHLAANALEVVDGPFDFGRRCDGEVMQHRVGRTAGGHDQAHHILDRLARDDVARTDVLPDRVDQRLGRFPGGIDFLRVRRGHRRGMHQAHAKCFERGGHGVGGIHAAAGAYGRTRVLFDAIVVFLAHLAGAECPDRLESTGNGQVLALPVAGLDAARVNVDRGHVHARDGDHSARHVLVAAADDQRAVHHLAVDGGFDGVGDHFA